jgi:molybdopterin-dependent oxidoreductase-like protein
MSDSRMPGRHLAECYFMKPQRFEYRAPDPLDEAVALLAVDQAAKPIAGGQSLVAVLASGSDLRRLPGLGDIVLEVDGVRLGAKVRWHDIEDDPRLSAAYLLLRMSPITRSLIAARSAAAWPMLMPPQSCPA